MDPVVHAEKQVKLALDNLMQTGALQKSNCMDIESLLNLAGESSDLTETSDKEIFDAVMEGIAAWETSGINGCDNGNDEEPVVPLPTRRDTIGAVHFINDGLHLERDQ
jgi:hypothetical protein